MPITVTTTDDEGFNGGSETDEANDGNGLSLREAFDLIGAGTSTGPITFAAPGDTFFLSNGPLNVAADIVLDGDLNDDGIADIFINMTTSLELMLFDVDGVTFENAGAFFTLDGMGSGNIFTTGFRVQSDDVSIINGGDIFTQSDFGFRGEIRGSAIEFAGDNFTLTNQLGATIVTAGRVAVDALRPRDPDTFEDLPSGLNTTVINDGLIEGADDGIRLASGTITNSGTIRTTGVYDIDGTGTNFGPGVTSDAIQTFANYDPAFMPDASELVVVDNLVGGLIEGVRSAMLISGGLTVSNAGTITAQGAAVAVSQFFIFVDPSLMLSDTNLSLDNAATGIIERTGGADMASFNAEEDFATIRTGGEMESATVINAGQILSVDLVISAYNAMTLVNQAGGIIRGDSDSAGDDAVAFRGSISDDFSLATSVGSRFFSGGETVFSTQGYSISATGQLVTPAGDFEFQFGEAEAAVLGRYPDPILPLVDLAATQTAGFVVYQTDGGGATLYPDSFSLIYPDLGPINITGFNTPAFEATFPNGDTVFDIPAGINFDDVITNDGTIIGDILTGIGDDTVTNNSDISGVVDLGFGDDTFDGTNGNGQQIIFGGEGDDIITGGDGGDTIDGGSGIDTANYDASDFRAVINLTTGTANGGDANGDSLTSIENIVGTSFNDFLTGDTADNTLAGNSGNDNLRGLSGDDILLGQDGADNLEGGGGNDRLEGGAGADMIDGTSGRDQASYESSTSRVVVNLFNGAISGGHAQGDTLSNIDDLLGSQFNDIFNGNNSANTLEGGDGIDFLFGRGGRDNLFGGNGNDTLNGGGAFDRLDGGAGNDTLTGGVTRDVFLFDDDFGQDLITDFGNNLDTIDFSAHSLINVFADVSANAVQSGTDVVIMLDANNQLTLQNFNLADLDASDFIF